MDFLLITAAALLLSVQSIALKRVKVDCLRQNLMVTGVFAGIIAASLWIWCAIEGFSPNGLTLLFGLLFGFVFVATLVVYYKTTQTGPLSYAAFFYSASMLIPALGGLFLWQESFTWQVGMGILLFLAAFYLISVPGKKGGKAISRKWVLLCFFSWLLNGCCSLTVKGHQMLLSGGQYRELLTIAYTAACVASLFLWVLSTRKGMGQIHADWVAARKCMLALVLAAVGNGAGNLLVTFLSSRLGGAYLYPMVFGGMMVLVTLYSAFFLKEKLGRRGLIGMLAGVCAVVVINL